MLIVLVFCICSILLVIIQTTSHQLFYQNLYEKDKYKSLAAFVRSSENFNKIRLEEELGISSSFFDQKTTIRYSGANQSQYIPYDFVITTNMPYDTLLNSNEIIEMNNQKISAKLLKHYAKCLFIRAPSTQHPCSPLIWNPHS